MNQVLYNEEARQRIQDGARILYEAVKTTMGPKGGNVVFEDEQGRPNVTHDGVTVAKNVNLVDDDETAGRRMGAELIKQAASKMNDVAGDGTTTVTVLTYHILAEANKLIAAGYNPMLLRREIEQHLPEVLKTLDGLKEDIAEDRKRIAEVATISAGDPEIGEIIAGIVEVIGKEGVITVEDSPTGQTTSEVVNGFTFDRGWMSPYMVTDTGKMEAVYENPAIIVSDKSISNVRELIPVLEKLATAGKRELFIVAENIEGEALSTLLANHLKGTFNVVAVRAPGVGDRRRDALADIAALTGATVLSTDRETEFQDADENSIGSARKIIVTETQTTIVEGNGILEDIDAHVASVGDRLAASSNEADKEYYARRKASLSGRVAVIRVGGSTETEMIERRYRVDDAVAATKAALKEGIVSGGGVTLAHLAKVLSDKHNDNGAKILAKAFEQPFRILMENAGLTPERWLHQITHDKGINVNGPEELVDLKKAGVIDPVVVTKQAVENSISIAATALTMGGLILRKKRSDAKDMNEIFSNFPTK